MLRNTSGPYAPANVWVTALRPGWSLVNGLEASSDYVLTDTDELSVDLDYAASAGHIHYMASIRRNGYGGQIGARELIARR